LQETSWFKNTASAGATHENNNNNTTTTTSTDGPSQTQVVGRVYHTLPRLRAQLLWII
jgi:hypothetical protein